MKKVKLSIIIVNYKVEKELLMCIESIEKKLKRTSYEVIVVENGNDNLARKLRKYTNINYLRSPKNLGYGAGNNFGASYANGEYIFILNPDTVIKSGDVSKLLDLLKKKKVGIIAPTLVDRNGKQFELQGTKKLTIFNAIFSLSWINKIWPSNPVSSSYWLKGIDRKNNYEVDVVPGTAFIIKKKYI